jgi:hypothetical protein
MPQTAVGRRPVGRELLKLKTIWERLAVAPKDRKILLFCPVLVKDGKPDHGYVVGWWQDNHWVAEIDFIVEVYPSRWAELIDEPEAPAPEKNMKVETT